MLISCNPRCKKSDGRTEGSLDVERNEVVCKLCGDDISGISSFTKQSMKQNKDIVTTAKKAFMFDCKNCHKKVETVVVNGVAYGKDCQTKNCTILISEMMANAMEKISPTLSKLEDSDERGPRANKTD
jgi:hypothetical protein